MSRIPARVVAVFIALSSPIAVAADTAMGKGVTTTRDALPATPEAWLARMLDSSRNGVAFKDPEAFAEWLDTITEPRFMTALAAVAADPATYPKAAASAIDPAAARNWSEFTDPQLYLRWMLAGATPSFQQAIIRKMTGPDKMKHWVEAISRPDLGASMSATFGRAPSAWMRMTTNPDAYAPRAGMAQPGTPMAWFGAMAGGVGRHFFDGEWLTLPADKTAGSTVTAAVRYRF